MYVILKSVNTSEWILDREMCRYMRYKEQEAIKETIDIIIKNRQQKKEEEGNEWPLRAIVLLNISYFYLTYHYFFVTKQN